MSLSKKLKRRIQELCGLLDLNREERLLKANEILRNNDLKQAICHQILGCTFKDIEKAMNAVLKERQITEAEEEQLELEELAPDKFDLELDFKVNKHASNVKKYDGPVYLTREDVARLMAASNREVDTYEPDMPPARYPTMDRETCERLVREHLEYKEEQKRKKKDQETLWDFTKMTESVTKTEPKTKPTKPTKRSKRSTTTRT